jgi:hypothetical protein
MNMNNQYQSVERCGCCGGFKVDAKAVARMAEKLIDEVGVGRLRERLGVSESMMRSLRNGTRRWGWRHVEKMVAMAGKGYCGED